MNRVSTCPVETLLGTGDVVTVVSISMLLYNSDTPVYHTDPLLCLRADIVVVMMFHLPSEPE